jgi:hypothetical protein
MEPKLFLQQLKKINPELSKYISPIIEADFDLISSNFPKPETTSIDNLQLKFENSFEYIRLYFNSGQYLGFKLHDDNILLIFAITKKKKPHLTLFKPFDQRSMERIPDIIINLSTITGNQIQMVCLDNESLNELKRLVGVDVKNIKEFNYYIYDLDMLGDLAGNRWKNVRQKINNFNTKYPKLKIEKLGPENYNNVLHFIGQFRRELLDNRGHSYANLEKNKFAVQYYLDKNDFRNIWSTIYKLQGRVVAVQLLYRLGENSAAHAIGLADTEFTGLAEAAQIDIWRKVYDCGIRFINDGPSWRPGLDRYKRKFNPIHYQRVFECKIKSK